MQTLFIFVQQAVSALTLLNHLLLYQREQVHLLAQNQNYTQLQVNRCLSLHLYQIAGHQLPSPFISYLFIILLTKSPLFSDCICSILNVSITHLSKA